MLFAVIVLFLAAVTVVLFLIDLQLSGTIRRSADETIDSFVADSRNSIERVVEADSLILESWESQQVLTTFVNSVFVNSGDAPDDAASHARTFLAHGLTVFFLDAALVINPDKRIILRVGADGDIGRTPAFRSILDESLNSFDYRSGIIYSPSLRKPLLVVISPLLNTDGSRVGALAVAKILNNEYLQQLFPRGNEKIFTMTDEGAPSTSNTIDARGESLILDFLQRYGRASLGSEVSSVIRGGGRGAIIKSAPYVGKKSTPGARLLYYVDISDWLNMERSMLGAIVAFLLFVIAIGGALFRVVIRPLNRLEKNFVSFASGNIAVTADVEGRSFREFRTFGGGLNEAVRQIQGKSRQLAAEKDKLSAILSSMSQGLVVVDDEKRLVLANQAAEKILKVPVKDLLGKDIRQVVSFHRYGQELDEAKNILFKSLLHGTDERFLIEDDVLATTPSGSSFWIVARSAPLRSASAAEGRIGGAIMLFYDAAEEKHAEEARKSFISIASHQLRTPLTSIRWFMEMLLQDDSKTVSPEQRQIFEDARQQAMQMNDVINLLLQMARVEMGRVRVDVAPVDLAEMAETEAMAFRQTLVEKKQTIRVAALSPRRDLTVPADRAIVRQVILNLLSNAVHYSTPGTDILVSVERKGDFVQWSVHNEGIGVPEADKPKLFAKFHRAANALKAVPEGSGLGLSLAKMLVEGWDGRIWFESEENKGATFHFSIPISGMKERPGEVGIAVGLR